MHGSRGGGWKRGDLAMVTAVKRPEGETRGKLAAGTNARQRHRASPRPYTGVMSWPDGSAGWFLILSFCCRRGCRPAVAPGGRRFHGRLVVLSWSRGRDGWSWWRQGQDPGERVGDVVCPGPGRRDFQVPAALAFDDPPGGVQDLVAQGLWFCFGEVAVEGEEPQPGQQVTGDGGGLAPGGVDLVVREGRCPRPVLFAQRILSSTLAWVLWRASRNWICPPGVLVAVTW